VAHKPRRWKDLGGAPLRFSGVRSLGFDLPVLCPRNRFHVADSSGRGKPRPYSVLHERRAAEKPSLRKDLGGASLRFSGREVWVLTFQYCVPEMGCTSQTLAGGASPAPTTVATFRQEASPAPTRCYTTRKSRLPSVTAWMRSNQIERKWRVTSQRNRRAGCIRSFFSLFGMTPTAPRPLHRTTNQVSFGGIPMHGIPFLPRRKTGRGKPRPYDGGAVQAGSRPCPYDGEREV
jgi:hypothetical protein